MPSPNARLLLRVFAAAIFLSATLLFAVQPMFTKMVLPRLGGTPSVWSVAMVFFQAVLLAGYAYAHALTRYLPGKRSVMLHVAVMAAATLFLPLAIAPWWGHPPTDATAALWLLGLFAVSIGLPFFALSANGPLLRAWFAPPIIRRRQTVLSLCGEQYRQLPRAALLSVRARAAEQARPADGRLGRAVRRADRADRLVRRADAAQRACRCAGRCGERGAGARVA
jgi:hypothetical protein